MKFFNPELCRNESEVESKLIVSYLLPRLGYSPDTWHQEVTFSSIRLDFLAFATQAIPFVLDASSPLSVIMEAKHPQQNLNRHLRKFRCYLTKLHVKYGLLTNGKELRIYERVGEEIELVFQCRGREIETKIEQIKAIIGKDSQQENRQQTAWDVAQSPPQTTADEPPANAPPKPVSARPAAPPRQAQPKRDRTVKVRRSRPMKKIAVYHNKGGVGKTTTVINLAAALSKRGKRVLIIDMDSQANTTFAVGLVKFVDEEDDNLRHKNILQVISSRAKHPISEVAQRTDFTSSEVDAIPSHISIMAEERRLVEVEATKTRLDEKLKQVEGDYDIVIIDTPPSLNLYARIALITADYLIIPSDLKPFANEGLKNVEDFVQDIDEFRAMLGKPSVQILGVLPSKISTNSRFVQYTLPRREAVITERYNLPLMQTRIFEREDLARAVENTVQLGDLDIPDPKSVFDYKPDSQSAEEFDKLALEVMDKIGKNQ
ncbi:AAA family ATPase [Phormidium sp. CCY1219]|uniref:AAA family ATPase n=1 Tax=Phormidium sp. CCY1219 TaxID=2886104 RepID=UPI002D1E8902|nr:AAA family ATPase [Phormidium sp. CCY1219]MEB3827952.1 AAA family ATPase [Phormidium sp. CCY1219]